MKSGFCAECATLRDHDLNANDEDVYMFCFTLDVVFNKAQP